MSASLDIRKAEPEDVRTLGEIAYTAWESGILPLLTERPGMREAERRRLIAAAGELVGRAIVASFDGHPVGWCARAKATPYIPYLFVMPVFQGQGIGALLLRRMEAILELHGHDRVMLETPVGNVRAVRFYQRQGYHILALKADGRQAQQAFMSVRLEKRLHPFTGPIPDDE